MMRLFLLVCCAVVLASHPLPADEWPQWMGPRRDNVWREDGVLEALPAAGPRVLWRVPIAGGYAGAAVAGGRVFVTDYVTAADVKVANFERKTSTGTERVLCLDEATGNQLWKHEYPVTYTIAYRGARRRSTATASTRSVPRGISSASTPRRGRSSGRAT